jgi:hippurate hydrolase
MEVGMPEVPALRAVLTAWTPRISEQIAQLYRDLHRHPELSMQEHHTAAAVVAALEPLGLDVTTGVGGTGVVAVLRNGDGPVVMLRADMDGLPVAEDTGLPYASTALSVDAAGSTVAVAHACGHDMHTACLVGALSVLADGRNEWSGTVMAVFQPAEELVCGASAMIADGLFERFPNPQIVLGQHVGPLPAGMIGYARGRLMAAADSVNVTLYGHGGHASRPENAVDPVVMAAAAVMRLQTLVAREISSNEQSVLTVGRLQAGTKNNIIPDTAEIGIDIRTYSDEVRNHLRAAVERIVCAEARASAAPRDPSFDWALPAPVLISDPDATDVTVSAFHCHFGVDRLLELPPVAASEDVGAFGAALGVPTVYWFFGGIDPEVIADANRAGRPIPFNHSPQFAPAIEPTLTTGVNALALAALTWLSTSKSGQTDVSVGP